MLAFLRGKIKNKTQNSLILDVRDVGYKIQVNKTVYLESAIGQEAEFYIYHHIREDQSSLFGFYSLEQQEMFELLLSISGVGPKSALGVLSAGSIEEIKDSLARGDSSLLTKVSGIGKKTAERMVLELRDKVGSLSSGDGSSLNQGMAGGGEEIDALMALGYSLLQAREALREVDPSVIGSGERIRAALKRIGR